MTTPTLPVDGQTPWGDELNTGILQVNSNANSTAASLTNHRGNIPADPHGDRSYAQSLVNPITTGVNGPNGYVKLNSSGRIIASQVTGLGGPGGMYSNVFDAIATYGMTAGSSDSSGACQNACNAASSAGGGIVYIGPGTFSFSNYVVIPSNVWIIMTEGTIINRIAGGTTPAYLFTNIKFGTSNSPNSNIRITGGRIDATANGLTSACTPIFIIQSGHTVIDDCRVFTVANNPAIELNGVTTAVVRGIKFGGNTNSSPNSAPAVRINISNSGTTPAGLAGSVYNNTTCTNVVVNGCTIAPQGGYGTYAGIAGTDLVSSGQVLDNLFHSGISVTGNIVSPTNANPQIPQTVFSNSTWANYNVSGNSLPELSSTNDGWFPITLQNGWTNSGSGPVAQWRFVASDNGSPGGFSALPYTMTNSIEIIGDVVMGTNTSGTQIAAFPPLNTIITTGQVVPVTFTTVAPQVGARLFFNNNNNTLQTINMNTMSGARLFFHAFISMTA